MSVAARPKVVLAGGHRIDEPGRTTPRFPATAEGQVAEDIEAALSHWGIGDGDLVVCAGANGADILTAEASLRRGAGVLLVLPLPEEEFVARSVRVPGSDWEERFGRLRRAAEVVVAEPDGGSDIFLRFNRDLIEIAVDRASRAAGSGAPELHVLAVWDRKLPDTITSDLVQRVKTLWRESDVDVHLRVVAPGPKRLLAVDGGGIRGVLSLEVLARIEELLRAEMDRDDDFVLADYFDYIGGTSTGAIIATGLALGWPVSRLQALYRDHGALMFKKVSLLRRVLTLFRAKFHKKNLEGMLRAQFGDSDLGSDALRTLLMVVVHNSNSDSPWPLSSHPAAKYNDRPYEESNLRVPLWQIVRASTAAPTFFPPERVSFHRSESVFVDGGLTPYNNPAFQLFLMATAEPYRLGWAPGADRMLLVSVGTGATPRVFHDLSPNRMNVIHTAKTVPNSLMGNATVQQDVLCRIFGDCRFGDPVDRELGDLRSAASPVGEKLFTYLRYDAELTRRGLDDLGLEDVDPEAVRSLDSIDGMDALSRVGDRVGARIRPEHFAGFLGEAAGSEAG